MSSRCKVHDSQLPHFVTSTVVGWVDALSRGQYKDILCKSLMFCKEEKGLILHVRVIMSNHVHFILSIAEGFQLRNEDKIKYTILLFLFHFYFVVSR